MDREQHFSVAAHGVEIFQGAGYDGKRVMGDTLTWLLKTSDRAGFFLQLTLASKVGSCGFTICLRPAAQVLNQGLLLQISNHLLRGAGGKM